MKYLLLGAVVLLCAGCGLLSPEQQANALEVIDQMLRNGQVTEAQYAALREAILSKGSGAWWEELGLALGSAALAYAGVQIRRGPPTQRVGLPADKVHPVSTSP